MSIKNIQQKLGVTANGVWGNQSQNALMMAIKSGVDINISENFHFTELIHSNSAVRHNIDNTPNTEHTKNLLDSVINLWQPTRTALSAPMLISSGYRSPRLNKIVGGSSTSAHSIGCAIDFTCPKFGNTRKIAEFLVDFYRRSGIKFDQLILEFPDSPSSWVHLGYKGQQGQQRGQVLTAKKINGRTQYPSGLV